MKVQFNAAELKIRGHPDDKFESLYLVIAKWLGGSDHNWKLIFGN